ncbi:MAG: c-type cytochrome [Planctomycetes bacterium]|nr:c-type cytochrome [Planctomycetota bacterium]
MRSLYLPVLLLPFLSGCSGEPAGASGANILAAPLGLADLQLLKAEGNDLTAAKAELGKVLFFDTRMSQSGKMSCASCHHADKAFTDGQAFSTKDNGKKNSRNSPTMYNVGYYPDLYWDGRTHGLEENVPAAWKGQLGADPAAVAKTLNGIAGYKPMFQTAFGAEASEQNIVQALSSFLRALRSGNSKFDQNQLSEQAKAGKDLFMGKAGCVVCHTPPLFTDRLFHNVGIGMDAAEPDLGRFVKTKSDADKGRFKTPTLREIAKTAPYFHDGSAQTLKDAVKVMAGGGKDNANKDPLLMDKKLSDAELDQLVAFLESLSGDVPFTAPQMPQ